MTKREILNEMLGNVLSERQYSKAMKAPKELLEKWYNEFKRVEAHPEVLRNSLKDWQFMAAYMLGGMY